jgi:acyl-coenzyme A thioesterase PaaI-like protein
MTDAIQVPPPGSSESDTRGAARDRLGAAARTLLDAIVRSAVDADDLEAAAAEIEGVIARLRARPPRQPAQDNPFHPNSLVGGTAHPIAPQLHLVADGDGVHGSVVLGPAFEGGPGLVHGGILALLFDHSMGAAVYLAGHAAMTRTLDIAYGAPTPIDTEIVITAHVEHVEGRRVHVIAESRCQGVVTATATAVFIALTADNVRRIFDRSHEH